MGKIQMSFEDKRRALRQEVSKATSAASVTKTIQFRNEDVPRFLERLREFERESRKSKLLLR